MTSKKLQANSGTLQIGGTVSFDNAPSISGSGFVTLTDAQTVDGEKTFTSNLTTKTATSSIILVDSDTSTFNPSFRIARAGTTKAFFGSAGVASAFTNSSQVDDVVLRHSGNFLVARNDVSTTATFTSSGNVGIGTSNPISQLTISRTTSVAADQVGGVLRIHSTASEEEISAAVLFAEQVNNANFNMGIMYSGQDNRLYFTGPGVGTSDTGASGSVLDAYTNRIWGSIARDTGAWTLGPSTGLSGSHIIRNSGNAYTLLVQNSDTDGSAGGLRILAGGSATSDIPLQVCRYNGNVLGQVLGDGAWTLGPTTGATHTVNGGLSVNGNGTIVPVTARANSGSLVLQLKNDPDTTTVVHRFTTTASTTYEIRNGAATANGVSLVAGGNSWGSFSDARLKTNVQDLDLGLTAVLAIQARRFNWADSEKADIGFVAQELQPIVPEVVNGNADSEEMMTVMYSQLTPVLVKAIQELNAELQAAKAEIELLKNPA